MSVPTGRAPAGITIVALPPFRVVAAEAKLPLVSVTVPVGVGVPEPPLTTTVTVSACAVVTLEEDGVMFTIGVGGG